MESCAMRFYPGPDGRMAILSQVRFLVNNMMKGDPIKHEFLQKPGVPPPRSV